MIVDLAVIEPKTMATPIGSSFTEDQSTSRPPLFNSTNYTFWKARMKIFIQTLDYDMWGVITRGPHTPTLKINGASFPKPQKN